jgi:hypothetical protein
MGFQNPYAEARPLLVVLGAIALAIFLIGVAVGHLFF